MSIPSPLRDILDAIFTASPKILYLGVFVPTTPAAHVPELDKGLSSLL